MSTSTSRPRPPPVLLRCLLLAAFLLATLSASLAPREPKYLLVIDAGSSGTRIHAYAWRPPSSTKNPLPSLTELSPSASEAGARRRRRRRNSRGSNRRLEPGAAGKRKEKKARPETRDALDRVETSPGLERWYRGVGEGVGADSGEPTTPERRVAEALSPLLSWADDALPPPSATSSAPIPVLFIGTAGIRRLPRDEREGVLAAAGEAIERWRREDEDDDDDDGGGEKKRRRQRFFAASPPRIAAGADEAAYAWAARAFASGKLARRAAFAVSKSKALSPSSSSSSPPKKLSGGETEAVLDLGGSSLEVAFAEDDGDERNERGETTPTSPSSETRHISFGTEKDQVIRLHASSHAGLGLDDAFLASVERLWKVQQRRGGERGDGGVPFSSSSAASSSSSSALSSSSSSSVLKLPKALAAALHVGGGSAGASGDDSDSRHRLPRLPLQASSLFSSFGGGRAATAAATKSVAAAPDEDDGDSVAAPVVRHPCLGPGRATTLRLPPAEASRSPPTERVRVVGDPHWGRCAALARSLVPSPPSPSPRRASNGRGPRPLPSLPAGSPVAALSGFSVVHSRFGLSPRDGPGKLLQTARRECSERWSLEEERGIEREEEEERQRTRDEGSGKGGTPPVARKAEEARNKERPPDDDIDDDVFCFRAAYASSLLRDGFGLSPPRLTVQSASGKKKREAKGAVVGDDDGGATPSSSFVFFLLEKNKKKAHPKHAGWPLGAALLEGSSMLEAAERREAEERERQEVRNALAGGVVGESSGGDGDYDSRARVRSLSAYGSAAASLGALAVFLREHGRAKRSRKARDDDEEESSSPSAERRKSCKE